MFTRISLTAVLLFIIGTSIAVGQNSTTEKEVINTLDGFHQAIIDNDSQAAQNLLSESVRILEGGNIETKEEYLSHHFHSDGKFLSAMKREVESRNVTIEGNTAWVSTHSQTWGTYSDRKLDLNSLELAVLKKEEGHWQITALHWSSASRN
ncbi:nuclear transport factor 2 family protein [Aliifodinibius sp. S!AR15-10]|uniref:nuclear transport factor 2 family protein n=1 Tax=Aliifodinibius sp. S!AR15-10 TaxID=2950437 RepID=UPI0028605B66|nr:nuclear transport factor 2 family protein [Aliifodinibius sp. S!AR15-10]MDR8391433.1 nuclear transport factor 2 family protein [Aliifodinibius sp. S!AR15-10]